MISNFFNIKFIVNIGIFVVILGTIIYLSYDVFNLTLIKIFPEEYAINECPNGKKIRIKPSTELPVEFNNMMYEVGFVTDVTDGDTIKIDGEIFKSNKAAPKIGNDNNNIKNEFGI